MNVGSRGWKGSLVPSQQDSSVHPHNTFRRSDHTAGDDQLADVTIRQAGAVLGRPQTLFQVTPQVLDMLDPDRHPNQALGHCEQLS